MPRTNWFTRKWCLGSLCPSPVKTYQESFIISTKETTLFASVSYTPNFAVLSVLKFTILSDQIVEDNKEFNSKLFKWSSWLFAVTDPMSKQWFSSQQVPLWFPWDIRSVWWGRRGSWVETVPQQTVNTHTDPIYGWIAPDAARKAADNVAQPVWAHSLMD